MASVKFTDLPQFVSGDRSAAGDVMAIVLNTTDESQKITPEAFLTYYAEKLLRTASTLSTTLQAMTTGGSPISETKILVATDKTAINSSLSIGQASNPTARVDVKGSGATSATSSILVSNSSSTELLRVRDDGYSIAPNFSGSAFRFRSDPTNAYMTWQNGSVMNIYVGGTAFYDLRSTGMGIGGTPLSSALLTLISTTKGFRPPAMTTAQRTAISSPAAGLIVYDTDINKLFIYTTAWEQITSA